uniref:Beta-1,4-galactosyltransferase n=1 Tax=Arion vulgaris TaxID=1028688 RepID=A0A0B7ALF1_9EUPU
MFPYFKKKKVVAFLVVTCIVPLSFNLYTRMSARTERQDVVHTLQRLEGPPAFQISDSRTHTYLLRERSSLKKSSATQEELRANTTIYDKRIPQEEDSDDVIQTTVSDQHNPTVVPSIDGLKTVGNDSVNWCPDRPPFLEGPLADMVKDITPAELEQLYPNLEKGGRLRPKICTPRQRLALIMPYRNRYPHLHIMLNNIIPILKRQQADVTFFVIEQALPGTFNRGALLNIGFLEAEKTASFDCYIFHDVDMIPLNDYNFYRCGDNPRHFAVAMNKFGFKMFYKSYFGAVVGFTKQQYLDVNGCSNIYFGWGGEDDDLLSRSLHKNYSVVRYDPKTARYDMIKHKRDQGNEENVLRKALHGDAIRRQDKEGLNTIKYKVNNIRMGQLYTWINVSLNMTEILQTAPEATLKIMANEMRKRKEKLKLQQQQGNNTIPH